MKHNTFSKGALSLVLIAAATLSACAHQGASVRADSLAANAESATYAISVTRSWSEATHPVSWPGPAAHLSAGIAAVHNGNYTLFNTGALASPGLELLSQKGQPGTVDTEMQTARASGNVGAIARLDPIRVVGGVASASIIATTTHPIFSVAQMVAPSPDWFTGTANVNLKSDGKWRDNVTLPLFAWDSGTNSATDFHAAKIATVPPVGIVRQTIAQFTANGQAVAVGEITLRRVQ